MTKKEYGAVRDEFLTTLKLLRTVEATFAEIPNYDGWDPGDSLDDLLDLGGYWLTGSDYRRLRNAIELMEMLTGRAAAQAS